MLKINSMASDHTNGLFCQVLSRVEITGPHHTGRQSNPSEWQ